MLKEIRNGSMNGIALRGVSLGHKTLSGILAFVATALIIAVPNI
jgi:hypothetical protein